MKFFPIDGLQLGKFRVLLENEAIKTYAVEIERARNSYITDGAEHLTFLTLFSTAAKWARENHVHPDLERGDDGCSLVVLADNAMVIRCGFCTIKDRPSTWLACWTQPASVKVPKQLASEAFLAIKEYLFEYGFADVLVMLLPVTDDSTTENATVIEAWCVRDRNTEQFDDFAVFDTPCAKGAMAYQRRSSYFVGKYSTQHKVNG